MILAASRKKAVCFSLKADADAIYEAIQELFDDLGGVTLELLIDNPKSLVIENNPRSQEEVRYNPYALIVARQRCWTTKMSPKAFLKTLYQVL